MCRFRRGTAGDVLSEAFIAWHSPSWPFHSLQRSQQVMATLSCPESVWVFGGPGPVPEIIRLRVSHWHNPTLHCAYGIFFRLLSKYTPYIPTVRKLSRISAKIFKRYKWKTVYYFLHLSRISCRFAVSSCGVEGLTTPPPLQQKSSKAPFELRQNLIFLLGKIFEGNAINENQSGQFPASKGKCGKSFRLNPLIFCAVVTAPSRYRGTGSVSWLSPIADAFSRQFRVETAALGSKVSPRTRRTRPANRRQYFWRRQRHSKGCLSLSVHCLLLVTLRCQIHFSSPVADYKNGSGFSPGRDFRPGNAHFNALLAVDFELFAGWSLPFSLRYFPYLLLFCPHDRRLPWDGSSSLSAISTAVNRDSARLDFSAVAEDVCPRRLVSAFCHASR